MKKLLSLALVSIIPLLLAVEVEAATLCFSSPNGEVIAMTAPDMEAQLGLRTGSLYGVTLLAVPPADEGIVYSEGVEVLAYDYLDREALASCVFLPMREETATRLALLPNAPGGGYTPVSLTVTDRPTIMMSATVSAEYYAWALARRDYYAAVSAPQALLM